MFRKGRRMTHRQIEENLVSNAPAILSTLKKSSASEKTLFSVTAT